MNKTLFVSLALLSAGCAATPPPQPPSDPARIAGLCQGVAEDVRAQNPLYQRSSIVAVKPLQRELQLGKTRLSQAAGAKVYVLATPGSSRAWLERELQCHVARQTMTASGGAPDDPLVPRNGRATVRVAEAEAGYVVQIHGSDTRTAEEILERARALASPGGS